MTVTPEQAVDAANEVFGRHPGHRALHAKGTVLAGTFTATPEAALLSKAAHLQGEPVRVTARVSNANGNPRAPDYAPDVRGLAVKFYLPDGSRTDILAQTAPRFPSRTPDEFVELLRATEPSLSAPLKLARAAARNRGILTGLGANVPTLLPPDSYATIPYYAIHAYVWVAPEGARQPVRYTLVPEAAGRRLKPWEAKRLGRDYLQKDILERLPVRFTLQLQLAEPGDRTDDPSVAWPKTRRTVNAGTLELTGLDPEREKGGDVLLFEPTRVTDGIELSDDGVLRFRHDAYGASVARRMP